MRDLRPASRDAREKVGYPQVFSHCTTNAVRRYAHWHKVSCRRAFAFPWPGIRCNYTPDTSHRRDWSVRAARSNGA